MDQEVVGSVDVKDVVRTDEGGRGPLLDEKRPVKVTARPEIDAVVDRNVAPALNGIDPHRPALSRGSGLFLRRSGGGWRPFEAAAADDAQGGDVDAAARLNVAEQAVMLGFEGTPCDSRVKLV